MSSRARWDAAMGRVQDVLGTLVGVVIALVALLVSLEVVMATLGLGVIPWLNESIEYALYAGTFIAAPWALRQGAHVRVDLALTTTPRALAIRLEQLVDLAGAAISLTLGAFGADATVRAFVAGSVQHKMVSWPEWMLLAVIPVACLLLAVEFVLRLLRTGATAAAGLRDS